MNNDNNNDKIQSRCEEILKSAEASGYIINPDNEFTEEIVAGLITNSERYGYEACPCRLASGDANDDLDMVCPCDYRDADLAEYGTCYCGLYVSSNVAKGVQKLSHIVDRRERERATIKREQAHNDNTSSSVHSLPYPVWRCKVCGFLSANHSAPEQCPICKVPRERFEQFM